MTLRRLAVALIYAGALCLGASLPGVSGPATAAGPQAPILWDSQERLAKPDLAAMPRLRFLTTTDFPPFNFLDGSGRLSGLHIDLARAICAELGLAAKCEIQALPWDELDAALQKGEGEAILAGIAVTAKTREKYAFSRPYLQFPARFVVPKAKPVAEPIYASLQGKKIGVVAGSGHERLLRDDFGKVQVATYAKPEELYADLKAGKLDAAFGDGMRLSFWLDGSDSADCCHFAGGPYIAPEYLGTGLSIAVKADNSALAAAFDYALQQISVKGTFAELYLRYFPVSFY
ncbi:transporter substrate-binding domain-containing protein [Ollibium composti]|nr:transporter substrate-binding domain-containing protein [Mesorhizobium composti]